MSKVKNFKNSTIGNSVKPTGQSMQNNKMNANKNEGKVFDIKQLTEKKKSEIISHIIRNTKSF
jgi:hypothetical protein